MDTHLQKLAPFDEVALARSRALIGRMGVALASSWRRTGDIAYWITKVRPLENSADPYVRFELALAHAYIHQHGWRRHASHPGHVYDELATTWHLIDRIVPQSIQASLVHGCLFHLFSLSLAGRRKLDDKPLGELSGISGHATNWHLLEEAIGDAGMRGIAEGVRWIAAAGATKAINEGAFERAERLLKTAKGSVTLELQMAYPSSFANMHKIGTALDVWNLRPATDGSFDKCVAELGRLNQQREVRWLRHQRVLASAASAGPALATRSTASRLKASGKIRR